MVKSMTGFGRAETICGDYSFTIEIKAVNNRFLEVNCKIPRNLQQWEENIKRAVQGRLNRGKVDIFITYEYKNGKRPPISIDKQAVIAYYNEIREIYDLCSAPDDLSLMQICTFPGVMQTVESFYFTEDMQESVLNCLQEALSALILMREREGECLCVDLAARNSHLDELADAIAVLAPHVAAEYRDKLIERMKKVLNEIPIDETRILQEAAIYADKVDITEELTRLRSHSVQLQQTMKQNDSVGRKLDFIVQEMNREVNTIGSKANFNEITKFVIEAKSELEKIREQVQNLE